MHLMRTFLATLILVASSVVSLAQVDESIFRITESRLLKYIEENTKYKDTSLVPPLNYSFKTPRELAFMYYGKYVEDGDVEALYTNGTAFFREDFELPKHEHILLHELFHHVVYQLGAEDDFECRRAEEKEAYLLNNKFFKETGNGKEYNGLWIMLQNCNLDQKMR